MRYSIESFDDDGNVKPLGTTYPDLKQAEGVAKRAHELEGEQECGKRKSAGVRVRDQNGRVRWERTTSHDYLDLSDTHFGED